MTEEQLERKRKKDLEYRKKNLFRIGLDVRKEDIETLRQVAFNDTKFDPEGHSLQGWIKALMYSRCEEMRYIPPSKKKEE